MMGAESISVWSVLTVVMLPLLGGGFFLLWTRLDKHQDGEATHHDNVWDAIHELRTWLQRHQVECERRFVKTDDLRSLEERLDGRLSRIEGKLDAIVTPCGGKGAP
ncbi:MAG TPA: hypothetical protein VM661_16980 [Candidatus Sulfotelmatobacter sp.]|jgi:hypothetical protein|nr:hypothetical protein [Candidatus Sulfotelmatobacter sp.]